MIWGKPQPDQEGTDNVKNPVSDSDKIDGIKDEKPENKWV